jgi:3',5'-cyclic AMP phosphodiesterase CpdA
MKRLLAVLATAGVLSAAAYLSAARTDRAADPGTAALPKFEVAVADKNPWTGLTPNAAPEQFQFAVVSDRTGGHRARVFSRAVHQMNLLQPEFVMSVGDLIEGARTEDENRKQWDEFDGYAKQFKMPFFYAPGNHDANNGPKTSVWGERLGRSYYHFTYKGCLFVVLNTSDLAADDPAAKGPVGGVRIGKAQNQYLAKALAENAGVRWTFVFLHHPIWAAKDLTANGWLEAEKSLSGRKYTVFCGHVHVYRKYVRNGMNYYQLATTGGGSALRGIEYGEFDQFAWITVKPDGPVMANLLLSGIVKDDLLPFPSDETGGEAGRQPLPAVTGVVLLNGKPAVNVQVKFTEIVGMEPFTGTAKVTPDGTFAIYGTRREAAGLKPGRYAVTFEPAAPLVVDPAAAPPAENPIPEKYRNLTTTPFRVTVEADKANKFEFKLTAGE